METIEWRLLIYIAYLTLNSDLLTDTNDWLRKIAMARERTSHRPLARLFLDRLMVELSVPLAMDTELPLSQPLLPTLLFLTHCILMGFPSIIHLFSIRGLGTWWSLCIGSVWTSGWSVQKTLSLPTTVCDELRDCMMPLATPGIKLSQEGWGCCMQGFARGKREEENEELRIT